MQLNQITHPDALVQEKVNFFADYFNFVVHQYGKYDFLEVENHLSLIDKIIFQLETNLNNSIKYIDKYLSHYLLHSSNKYFSEYKNHTIISQFFDSYRSQKKETDKLIWIETNPYLIQNLKKFRTELKKVMFKKAMKNIISFLKCKHQLSEHQTELIYFTNLIASEYILNNIPKQDLAKFIPKILSKEIKDFPFSKSFEIKNKDRLIDAKKEFLNKRDFDNQFNGMYNLINQKHSTEYFIFKIYGIVPNIGFRFKYNKVEFFHPNDKKFNDVKAKIKEKAFNKDFFDRKDLVIGIVKINYFTKTIGENEAINQIKKELNYLNFICNSNAYLEKYSYLTTSDFKDLGWRWAAKESGHRISEFNVSSLNNNVYYSLKNINKDCKNHIINYEPLFIKAKISKSPEDYWQYLETLFPKNTSGKNQVIDLFTSLLVIDSKENNILIIRNQIIDLLHPFNTPHSLLNLTLEKQKNIHQQLQKDSGISFNDLKNEITHPLIIYLLEILTDLKKSFQYKTIKKFYNNIISECQAQRNSEIHSSFKNEKALILIDSILPSLVDRIRWNLFEEMKKNRKLNFNELLNKLKIDSSKLN